MRIVVHRILEHVTPYDAMGSRIPYETWLDTDKGRWVRAHATNDIKLIHHPSPHDYIREIYFVAELSEVDTATFHLMWDANEVLI